MVASPQSRQQLRGFGGWLVVVCAAVHLFSTTGAFSSKRSRNEETKVILQRLWQSLLARSSENVHGQNSLWYSFVIQDEGGLGAPAPLGSALMASIRAPHLGAEEVAAASLSTASSQLADDAAELLWPFDSKLGKESLSPAMDFQAQATLWSVVAKLRQCGTLGLREQWPDDAAAWNELRLQVARKLQGLAAIRSDNVSMLCSFQGERETPRVEDMKEEVQEEHDAFPSPTNSGIPRCPRCGHVTAPDMAVQRELLEFSRALLAPLDASSNDGNSEVSARANAMSLRIEEVLHENEASINCTKVAATTESKLRVAWNDEDSATVFAITAVVDVCGRHGVEAFLALAQKSTTPDSLELKALRSLLELRSAEAESLKAEPKKVNEAVSTLVQAVWQGVGFPILPDVLAKQIRVLVQLGQITELATGRLSGLNDEWQQPRPLRISRYAKLAGAIMSDDKIAKNSALSIAIRYEHEALNAWVEEAPNGKGGPLRVAAAYLDLAVSLASPLETTVCLVNAALWLAEAARLASNGKGSLVGRQAYLQVTAVEAAAAARMIAMKLLPPGPRLAMIGIALSLSNDAGWREADLKLNPLWKAAPILLADVTAFSTIAGRLHESFASELSSAKLGVFYEVTQKKRQYEAALLSASDDVVALAPSRRDFMGALLSKAQHSWRELEQTFGVMKHGPLLATETFSAIRGLRLYRSTGMASVLLAHPSTAQNGSITFTAVEIAALLASHRDEEVSISLQPLADSAQDFPFQEINETPPGLAATLRDKLLQAAIELRDFSTGITSSTVPPFPMRPSMHNTSLIDGKAGASVLCEPLPFSRKEDGDVVSITFGSSDSVVHSENKQTISSSVIGLAGQHETHSLALVPQLCALRSAGLALAVELQILKEGRDAEAQNSDDQKLHPQRVLWLQALQEEHAQVLRSRGYVDLDPGRCWGGPYSLARCCSVGDNAVDCWRGGFSMATCCGGLTLRDVTAEDAKVVATRLIQRARQEGLKASTETIESVRAWLRQPAGHRSDGRAFSAVLVDLLHHAASGEGVHNLGDAADRLSTEIIALHNTSVATASSFQDWVPATPLESKAIWKARLTPELKHSVDVPSAPRRDHVVELSLRDLAQRARHTGRYSLGVKVAAESSQTVQTLRRVAALLHSFGRKDVTTQHSKALASEAGLETTALHTIRETSLESIDKTSQHGSQDFGQNCQSEGTPAWVELSSDRSASLSPGQLLQIERRFGEKADGKSPEGSVEARVERIVKLDGSGQALHLLNVQSTSSGIGSGKVWHNLSQPLWQVFLPEIQDGTRGGQTECKGPELTNPVWPDCIEPNTTIRGSGGAGIFVNLASLGIKSGCFRGDCTHSDHFYASSPAICAKTCAAIRACKWWSFWSPPSNTCWLRSGDQGREAMWFSSVGSRTCKPAPGDKAKKRAALRDPSERTLFQLAQGPWGVGPHHPLHQWDLLPILDQFGHMTPSELRAAWPSALQQSALRFAQRAQA